MWGQGSRRPHPHRAHPSFLQVLAQGLPLPSRPRACPQHCTETAKALALCLQPLPSTVSTTANTLCVPLVVPWLQRRLLAQPRHPDLRLTHRRESTTCRARGWGRCGESDRHTSSPHPVCARLGVAQRREMLACRGSLMPACGQHSGRRLQATTFSFSPHGSLVKETPGHVAPHTKNRTEETGVKARAGGGFQEWRAQAWAESYARTPRT